MNKNIFEKKRSTTNVRKVLRTHQISGSTLVNEKRPFHSQHYTRTVHIFSPLHITPQLTRRHCCSIATFFRLGLHLFFCTAYLNWPLYLAHRYFLSLFHHSSSPLRFLQLVRFIRFALCLFNRNMYTPFHS